METTRINDQYYVDKTEGLEKGIEIFHSIYIEGAAALGKTTAVKMLIARHSEVKSIVLKMDRISEAEIFHKEIEKLKARMKSEIIWVVFENMPEKISREIVSDMVVFVETLPEKGRVIFVGREKPAEELLGLLWNRQMELLLPEKLLFTESEIEEFLEMERCSLSVSEVYAETGGWAGCVDMMIRLSKRNSETRSVRELRGSYEIATYIQNEIIDTLSSEEREMIRRASVYPWLNAELVREVWGMPNAEQILELLERKGMLLHDRRKKRWKITPLFQEDTEITEQSQHIWEYMGKWYESHKFIREAFLCIEHLSDQKKYREFLITHYENIPFLECSYKEVMNWKDSLPQSGYLRGMYCYSHQDFEGLKREIEKLNPMNGKLEKEIYLNLCYLNPEITLEGWLELLEKYAGAKKQIRLYGILGNSPTFLCGFRDLTGLFAGSRKEENRKAKLWKEWLQEEQWFAYQMAKIDYYVETERRAQITEEEWKLLEQWTDLEPWQYRLAKLYLCMKLQRLEASEENADRIRLLEESLMSEDSVICRRNTMALAGMHCYRQKETDKTIRWLRRTDLGAKVEVTEENYVMLYCQAKEYLFINQYEKTDRILRHLIPYLQSYRRPRLLAELLFQQSIVNWKEKKYSLALKNIIESFVVNGSGRYIVFYAGYGKPGIEILNEYIVWLKNHSPESWHRKKKYNYGNVLRMPLADYVEVILRYAKREERQNPMIMEENIEERLTMMEMIVLQNIGRGLTNAEICEELNLKITTVKSHIYNLYKKLGINSRVQAIREGKKLGLIE